MEYGCESLLQSYYMKIEWSSFNGFLQYFMKFALNHRHTCEVTIPIIIQHTELENEIEWKKGEKKVRIQIKIVIWHEIWTSKTNMRLHILSNKNVQRMYFQFDVRLSKLQRCQLRWYGHISWWWLRICMVKLASWNYVRASRWFHSMNMSTRTFICLMISEWRLHPHSTMNWMTARLYQV